MPDDVPAVNEIDERVSIIFIQVFLIDLPAVSPPRDLLLLSPAGNCPHVSMLVLMLRS